jgi:hypothetical protein
MSSSQVPFDDKCDSLKENDERYTTAKKLMVEQGCFEENSQLTACL